jgi:lipoprotein NlpD
LPGAENAGKPGYYTVKAGDTLIRIGLETGQGWKDIARWNNLDNPNLIEVGQVLRVTPPCAASAAAAAATETGVVTRPVASLRLLFLPRLPARPSLPPVLPVAVPAPIPASAYLRRGSSRSEDDVPFIWPASGTLLAGFDEARNKGYDIAGKAGDPVLAAADGRVVYAGAGLRGYGNLDYPQAQQHVFDGLCAQPGIAGQGRPDGAAWPKNCGNGQYGC